MTQTISEAADHAQWRKSVARVLAMSRRMDSAFLPFPPEQLLRALTLVPALREALEKEGRPDIMIVVGGVIPPGDFDELYEAGAAAIFPPGTVIADAAVGLISKLTSSRGYDVDSHESQSGSSPQAVGAGQLL